MLLFCVIKYLLNNNQFYCIITENKAIKLNMSIKLTRALPPSQRLFIELSHSRTASTRVRYFQRTQDPQKPAPWVIEECFTRLKATSKQYGIIGTIKYKCFIPLKSLIFGLERHQQAKLELYQQHQLLYAGIQKVEKACKKFLRAERATDRADNLVSARNKEYREAQAFIDSYNELIGLAVKQASTNHISESHYLQDLQSFLAQRSGGLIFRAVNRALAKYQLGNGICSPESTQALYLAFIYKFVDHVQKAAKTAGSTDTDTQTIKTITQGFIEGLASFPELDRILMQNLGNPSLIEREIHIRVGNQRINNEVKKQDRVILEAPEALSSVEKMQDIDLYLTISDPTHDPIQRVFQEAFADTDELLGPEFPAVVDPESEIETID